MVWNGAFQIAAKTSFSSFFGKRFHSFGYRRRDRFYRASLLFRAYIFYRNTRNPDSRKIERLLRIYSGSGDNVRIRNTIARKRARRYGEHSAHGLAPSARICGESYFFIGSEFCIIYLKINKKSRYDIKCGISCLAGEKWKDISSRERKGLKEKLK